MEYQELLDTYDAFIALKSTLEDALAACYDLQDKHREGNDFRRDSYAFIRKQLEECYWVADRAQTSFSYEIKPEDF